MSSSHNTTLAITQHIYTQNTIHKNAYIHPQHSSGGDSHRCHNTTLAVTQQYQHIERHSQRCIYIPTTQQRKDIHRCHNTTQHMNTQHMNTSQHSITPFTKCIYTLTDNTNTNTTIAVTQHITSINTTHCSHIVHIYAQHSSRGDSQRCDNTNTAQQRKDIQRCHSTTQQ